MIVEKKVKLTANPDPDECPNCGEIWNDEGDLTMADLHIDIQCGFVALKNVCAKCGKKLERFYDYDRTEAKEAGE